LCTSFLAGTFFLHQQKYVWFQAFFCSFNTGTIICFSVFRKRKFFLFFSHNYQLVLLLDLVPAFLPTSVNFCQGKTFFFLFSKLFVPTEKEPSLQATRSLFSCDTHFFRSIFVILFFCEVEKNKRKSRLFFLRNNLV
jgi:hypothetical protein